MRKFKILLFLFLLLCCRALAQQSDYKSRVILYIIQYREIAVREMGISHIPASITLAQGILESNAGQSDLARDANNHFGIKCHKEWAGETMYKDDDKPNECFRKYKTAEESFHDHSSFLIQRDRYKLLFRLKTTDYKGWAEGLKKAGYATSPTYAEKLIKTIETFGLEKLDHGDFGIAYVDSLNKKADENQANPWADRFTLVSTTSDRHQVYTNNNLKLTVVRKNDDLERISQSFNLSVRKLMRYNDMTNQHLAPGQIIYLESKRRKAMNVSHKVQQGETLWQISQVFGIKLKMLYKRNHIPKGEEPMAGQLILLR